MLSFLGNFFIKNKQTQVVITKVVLHCLFSLSNTIKDRYLKVEKILHEQKSCQSKNIHHRFVVIRECSHVLTPFMVLEQCKVISDYFDRPAEMRGVHTVNQIDRTDQICDALTVTDPYVVLITSRQCGGLCILMLYSNHPKQKINFFLPLSFTMHQKKKRGPYSQIIYINCSLKT